MLGEVQGTRKTGVSGPGAVLVTLLKTQTPAWRKGRRINELLNQPE